MNPMRRPLSRIHRILRQAVRYLVEIALVGAVDMMAEGKAARCVEGASHDRNLRRSVRLPEQRGAAIRAEAALRLLARPVPADRLSAFHRKSRAGYVDRGIIKSRLLSGIASNGSRRQARALPYLKIARRRKGSRLYAVRSSSPRCFQGNVAADLLRRQIHFPERTIRNLEGRGPVPITPTLRRGAGSSISLCAHIPSQHGNTPQVVS